MARALGRVTQAIINEKMSNLKQAIENGQDRHERTFGYIHNCYDNEKLNSGYKQTRRKNK
jgi:hypothetical protein